MLFRHSYIVPYLREKGWNLKPLNCWPPCTVVTVKEFTQVWQEPYQHMRYMPTFSCRPLKTGLGELTGKVLRFSHGVFETSIKFFDLIQSRDLYCFCISFTVLTKDQPFSVVVNSFLISSSLSFSVSNDSLSISQRCKFVLGACKQSFT